MDKSPFSLYDFFGYLAPGFISLVAVDYTATGGAHLGPTPSPILSIFWTLAAYVSGMVIANISGFLLEDILVKRVLGSPEKNLFSPECAPWMKKAFPSYYKPLSHILTAKVQARAMKDFGNESAEVIFGPCRAIARKDPAVCADLDRFLNLYGFCRNVSMSLFIVAAILLWGLFRNHHQRGQWLAPILWWVTAAVVASIGTLYRYLKFFRKYTKEVFVAYAAGETGETAHL